MAGGEGDGSGRSGAGRGYVRAVCHAHDTQVLRTLDGSDGDRRARIVRAGDRRAESRRDGGVGRKGDRRADRPPGGHAHDAQQVRGHPVQVAGLRGHELHEDLRNLERGGVQVAELRDGHGMSPLR